MSSETEPRKSANPRTAAMHAANRARKAAGLPIGRPRGTPNKLTATMRDAMLFAFDELGGAEAFARWARKHQTRFYELVLRGVPREREANALGTGVQILIQTSEQMRPVIDVTPSSDANQAAE